STEGVLEVTTLRSALRRVVQRHEICRTSFQRRPEFKFPIQIISEWADPFWQTINIEDSNDQESRIDELFRAEREQPIDLDQPSLLRATLLTLSSERNILIVSLPSLCADTRTLQNLIKEVAESYEACLRGEESEAEVTQYVEFSEWLSELLDSDEGQAGKDFWTALASFAQPALPLESKSVPDAEFVPDVFSFEIPAETAEPDVLVACWQTLLSRLTGHLEIVTSSLHEGRNDEALGGAFGPFARRLPVVVRFAEQQRFSDVLQHTRRSLVEANRWQDFFVANEVGENSFAFEFEQRPVRTVANGLTFTTYKQFVCDELFKVKLSCVQKGENLIL